MTTSAGQTPEALRAQLENGSLAGNWALDPARSTAALRSKSVWGLLTVKGVFGSIEGGGTVSPAGEVTGRIALATGSLDTKNKKRDDHLRSDDFFLTEKYPAITFTLDNLVPASEGVTVSGTLTVRETSRPISFPATVTLAGNGEVALDATVHVDRSEFGVSFNQLGMLSMKNTVTIHAVFTRN
ncbi:MAG TPA: YceI family protein [Streptosporangiaceae bacterium]|jgi:polyisoprenoid-binding protein YceI|nr:YceI family protein [Streptosporangiaceae bacterium]